MGSISALVFLKIQTCERGIIFVAGPEKGVFFLDGQVLKGSNFEIHFLTWVPTLTPSEPPGTTCG
jgi:hypothetical protein